MSSWISHLVYLGAAHVLLPAPSLQSRQALTDWPGRISRKCQNHFHLMTPVKLSLRGCPLTHCRLVEATLGLTLVTCMHSLLSYPHVHAVITRLVHSTCSVIVQAGNHLCNDGVTRRGHCGFAPAAVNFHHRPLPVHHTKFLKIVMINLYHSLILDYWVLQHLVFRSVLGSNDVRHAEQGGDDVPVFYVCPFSRQVISLQPASIHHPTSLKTSWCAGMADGQCPHRTEKPVSWADNTPLSHYRFCLVNMLQGIRRHRDQGTPCMLPSTSAGCSRDW